MTRERLYLESVESVLGSSTKVMIDLDGGNNLLYLPLDKILEPRLSEKSTNQSAKTDDSTNTLADKIRQSRDSFNSRKRSLYNE